MREVRVKRVLPVAIIAGSLLFALAAGHPGAYATTWTVNQSGGGDFATIQDGVDAASGSDTVLVRSGTYDEWVRILGKSGISVIGGDPVETVIITHDTIAVHVAATDPPVRIEGVTIAGSNAFGGLFAIEARVEVIGCIFRDNVGPGSCHGVGGGILAQIHSDFVIEDCLFENNTDWEAPGGVIIWESHGDLRRNIFRGNSACYGGGLEIYHCENEPTSYVEDNLFVGNSVSEWGGAVFTVDSSPVIRNNTFYGNDALGNAAIWVLGGSPDISRNVVVGSSFGIYCQSHAQYPPSTPVIGCNLFWNTDQAVASGCPDPGTIIVADPLFCSPDAGDFTICGDSPALSAPSGRLGAFGQGCPPCGVNTEETSWGSIKSLYH
jgi:hypothetical protein